MKDYGVLFVAIEYPISSCRKVRNLKALYSFILDGTIDGIPLSPSFPPSLSGVGTPERK
jgi:hypothetical protein